MTSLEGRTKERSKKRNIKNAILLGLLGGATIAGYAALGPAVLAGFVALGGRDGHRIFDTKLKRSLRTLIDKELVEFKEKNGKKYLAITHKGCAYLRRKRGLGYEVKKPKRWDGKWRGGIFDIKESRRADRDRLREELENIGFYRLQNSVWLYPYDCEDVVTLIKSDYRLGGNVVYMIVEEIENDRKLKEHFKLNKGLL